MFSRSLALLVAAFMLLGIAPALSAAANPSGLPLPRFATTKSQPINVRVGPGTRYDIAFVFVQSGLPVEIVAEFDTWRKIRYADGREGWVHQNLLSGNRAGFVAPSAEGMQFPLRAGSADTSGIRAWLVSGFPVSIRGCDGTWCEVNATDHAGGRSTTYSGYLAQTELWGVYQDEVFD